MVCFSASLADCDFGFSLQNRKQMKKNQWPPGLQTSTLPIQLTGTLCAKSRRHPDNGGISNLQEKSGLTH